MARRGGAPKGRPITGILLLDKPTGITSNEALQRVKRLYRARKAGHTGSLDPLASGLLPLCFGEATKISGFLLDADKDYLVECRLGQSTATGDAEGEVIRERPVPSITLAELDARVEGLRGEIMQVPPMYSAVKHQGERLYNLARQGVEVEREARPITIHQLHLISLEEDRLTFRTHCSKGTYVRTLAEDIGELLGCGAHVTRLRRLGVGPYGEEGMVTLEQLESLAAQGERYEALRGLDELLLPVETALAQWPQVSLSQDAAYYVLQGQPVLVPKAPTAGWVRMYEGDGRFLGMGQILDDGRVAPKRLMVPG